MTELKNMLLKANQEEVKKLDSFKAQPEYLLNFASKLAEKDLRILVYCTRKNKSKFLKIFIGDYLISRPAYSSYFSVWNEMRLYLLSCILGIQYTINSLYSLGVSPRYSSFS